MQCGFVGLQSRSVGLRRGSVGLLCDSVGLQSRSVGLQRGSVGVLSRFVGLLCDSVGLQSRSVGLQRPPEMVCIALPYPNLGGDCAGK